MASGPLALQQQTFCTSVDQYLSLQQFNSCDTDWFRWRGTASLLHMTKSVRVKDYFFHPQKEREWERHSKGSSGRSFDLFSYCKISKIQ